MSSARRSGARLRTLVLAVFAALPAAASAVAVRGDAGAQAMPASGSQVVRVPREAAGVLERAGVLRGRVQDYGRFLWVELAPHELAALQAAGIAVDAVDDARTVQVTAHRFDPLRDGEPTGIAHAGKDARGFRLVQFDGPVRREWLQALEQGGARPLQYYPHNTYLVWSEGAATEALSRQPFVRWHGAFHPGYKINGDLAGRSGRIDNVTVVFYRDGDENQTIAALRALGAELLGHHPSQPDRALWDAVVRIDAAALESVAKLDTVLWLGYAGPEPGLDDEMSSQILAGNHPGGVPQVGYAAYLAGLGYTGSGVRWAVIDTGVDYQHPDLGPGIVAGYSFPGACNPAGEPGSDCSGGGHGTHVAGIIGGTAAAGFADGSGFKYGLGVAPGYGIVALNSLMGSSWPPAGGWQENSKRAVLLGAIGTNNSWHTGEGTAHGYQASERTHDLMVHDGNFDTPALEPVIWVFSAGNSGAGASTLTAPKEAKNVITVASSVNYRAGSIDSISGFSSRGPAVDGRILPTVAAPGEQIASARNDLGGSCATAIPGTSNAYAFCSGTSMAAPQVSGALVLAAQWWRDFNDGANPSPAMAKALLVNSAVDIGAADRPNNAEGWGRVSIERMIAPANPVVYIDQEHILAATGESFAMTVAPADPAAPVQITLAWSDAAGAIGANPALVNNLDLVVEDGTSSWFGNVFSGGWSTTGGSRDPRSNLENVFLQSPSGAPLTITVEAMNIAGDGVPGNADPTDQAFALVCSNCVRNPDYTLQLTPASLAVCAPNPAQTEVGVGQLMGYDDPVTLDVAGVPAGLSATFDNAIVAPPGSTLLTLADTALGTPGRHTLLVGASSSSGAKQRELVLDLYDGLAAAPGLVAPAPGAVDVPTSPTLSWSPAAQAASYLVQVARDPGFTNVVRSVTTTGTAYVVGTALEPGTQYFWRVQAINACGAGAPSVPSSFTTAMVICRAETVPIPDNSAAGVDDTLVVGSGGALSDLDVSVTINHTWVGDLIVQLTHLESGTTVALIDRPGVPASTYGCSGDNIDAILDDAAAAPVESQCAAGVPTIGGTFRPNQPLAAFDGVPLAGTWRLNVSDRVGSDTGALQGWCLLPAAGPGNQPPQIFSQDFAVDENAPAGTAVGTVVATDPDDSGPLSFVVLSGTGEGLFVIDPATGLIEVADGAQLDYEAQASYTLDVMVSDGAASAAATMTIELNDLNEAPTLADQAFTVAEHAPDGAVLGTIAASDPDAGDSLAYTVVGGSGDGVFAVDVASGEIRVADGSQLDFETGPTAYTLDVEVRDSGDLSASATISIDVLDINEAPVVSGALADRMATERVAFAAATAAVFSDPDGDALTFEADDLPAGLAIDAGTGMISGTPLPGSRGEHLVTVRASDGELEASVSFTIDVAIEPPAVFRDGFDD